MFSQDYRKRVVQFLSESKKGFTHEVEIRYQQLTDDQRHLQPYHKQAYTKLLNTMKTIDPNFTLTKTTDKSYTEPPHPEFSKRHFNNTIITIDGDDIKAKTKLKFEDDRLKTNYEYGYTIGLAYEKDLDPESVKTDGKEVYIRDKHRHSFMINGNRLDMTRVSNSKEEKFEIEFELIAKDNLDQFFNSAQQIYLILNDTVNLYTQDERIEAFKEVNTILGHGMPSLRDMDRLAKDPSNRIFGSLDMNHLCQARNLRSDDLVYGGLIPSPFIDETRIPKDADPSKFKPREQEVYTVTHKADGFRKLLYINKVGLWLLMGKDANLVVRMNFTNNYLYTMFDGELIPKENRKIGAPDTKMWYLIFDCMSSPTMGREVQKLRHTERLAKAEAIAQKITNSFIAIECKDFVTVTNGNNPYSFFEVMRKMFAEQDNERYENDGFMFTPDRASYLIKTQDMISRRFIREKERAPRDCDESYEYVSSLRNLSRYPDICKWKPPQLMTVDLALQWVAVEGGRELQLYAYNTNPDTRRSKPYVRFNGTIANPYHSEMIDITQELQELPSLTVVEFGWNGSKLTVHKIRLDKLYPNGCEVAMDVWDIMQRSAVTKDTLMGMSFDMVRRFHNQIKSSLFYENKVPNGILLDIGSGRGGDVRKWKPNFNEIIAVEPNREHIEELASRVADADISDRVLIVPTGGENYEVITRAMNGRKADVISMMLSMSFFWNVTQPEMLTNLARTIVNNLAPNGKVIFLTQDGRALSEMFLPSYNGLILANPLVLGPASISLDGYVVDIDIKETIVQNQREYLVFIYDLVTQLNLLLGKETAKLEYFKTAFGDDKFMTEAEHTYTQLFGYGVIKLDSNVKYKKFLINNFNELKMSSMIESKISYSKPVEPKYNKKGRALPIPVDSEERDENERADGDDALAPVVFKGYKGKVYRLGTIGDGSCFFHALFKAIYPNYQDDPDFEFRTNLVARMRFELGALLLARFSDETQKNYYIVNNGAFPRMYKQQQLLEERIKEIQEKLDDADLSSKKRKKYEEELEEAKAEILTDMDGKPIDYSPRGLVSYIRSKSDVGDDIIAYVTSPLILNAAVIVIQCFEDGCRYVYDTIDKDEERPIAVIAGNGTHYETIAVERVKDDGTILLSTFFLPDDPFIEAIMKLKTSKK